MTRVRIEHRKFGADAKPEHPMRWAVVKATGIAIHIGSLGPDQNGNACDCKCLSCNADLQAVNAGKDASHFLKTNTHGMFFRHPSGHHRKDCNVLAAKFAALKLLMESDEVDLPAPKRTAVQQGISGATYAGKAEGQRWRGPITNKVWIDSQSATITVKGRSVLVVLQADTRISSETGIDGIITICVNDPDIASWEPNRILEALQFDSGFSCWDKHWDDKQLNADAKRHAFALADDAIDCMPSGWELDGLTTAQKSETVLHAKVKEILAAAGRLFAPFCDQEVTRLMDDGSRRTKRVHIDAQYLTLSHVRLESPLPGMVPDVLCTARSSLNLSESFTLIIEVAVTHRVDAAKKAKIAAQNLACIEVDLTRLNSLKRRIKVDQLGAAVIHSTDCKHWIFNPVLNRLANKQEELLSAADARMRLLREQEENRQRWMDNLDTQYLVEQFLPALKHYWLSNGPKKIDEKYSIWPEEIAQRLSTRGFKNTNNSQLIKKDGVLSCIEDIYSRHLNQRSIGKYGGLWKISQDPELGGYIALGLMAVKAYPLTLSPADRQWVDDLRQQVTDSWDMPELRFARATIHDDLIGHLFPGMRNLLAIRRGTLADMQEKVNKKMQLKRQEAIEKAREDADRNDAIRREISVELNRRAQMAREEYAHNEKIRDLLRRENISGWTQDTALSTIQMVLKQTGVIRLVSKYGRSGLPVEELLTSAWEARLRGASFYIWFSEQKVKDTGTAGMVIQALKTAGLVR